MYYIIHHIKKCLINIRDYYLVKIKWRKYNIGDNFHAGLRVRIWGKDSISIGKYCYIGRDSQIECNVDIGNYVLIANCVAFVGRYDHNYQQIGYPIRLSSQVRDNEYSWKECGRITVVEDDVWIGYGSIIMSGVYIGKGSLIAAGSIVTKNVEAYSIYAGVPAKKIGQRFDDSDLLKKHIEKYDVVYI